ncbi:MAG: PAS domain S-box protein [Chthoniobacterales bacterium]|nr:PAS domain S-box protein [Chthoniobacterales bacterium]
MNPVENGRHRPRVAELLDGVAGIDWNGDAPPLSTDGAWDVVHFLALAESMARAVTRVHERGVTHGDLRPENFRRRGEEILLTGFDHAVTFDAGHGGFTPLDRLPSDVAYLAPEQTGRMNRPVDYRADLYALGGTFYRLATGRAPHAGTDRAALIHAHLAAAPRPPAELAAWMPPVLSQIILRLLAKEPDERYQSASGLADDLASLRAAAEHGEPLDSVALRAKERVLIPRAPRRHHGRDHALGELRDAFDAVTRGGREYLFLAGEAGVGKTSLVNELQRPVALRGGHFVRGKCEQFRRDRPLLAPVQALRQLLTLLAGESEKMLHELRSRLTAGLGPEAGALFELLPELRLLTGELPSAPALDPREAQRRLNELLVRLVRLVSSPAQPLVLVIDDMQWADEPTLDFATALLDDEDLDGVLLVGLFRRDESGPGLARVTAKASPAILPLENLPPDELSSLVGEMLGVPGEEVRALAEQIHRATRGNPFHAIELVQSLHREGTLVFDTALRRWTWDAAVLAMQAPSANVVEFLTRNLSDLPPPTADALVAAACLGADLNLEVLALATDRTVEETAAVLLPALERGVLVTPDALEFTRAAGMARFAFCHDRMQQAAAALREEPWRLQRQLDMARRLAAAPDDAVAPLRAAGLYAEACALLEDAEEKEKVAALFLGAGRHARAAGAFATAHRFLRLALELLAPDPWHYAPALAWDLHEELHVVCYCLPDYAASDAAYAALVAHATGTGLLANAAAIQVMSLSNRTRYEEAVRLGSALLDELGIRVPLEHPEESFTKELAELYRAIDAGALQRLPTRGEANITAHAAAKLLNRMVPAAFFFRPAVANWLVVHAARTWAEENYDDARLYPMACLALATIPAHGDYATGYRAARASLMIGENTERGVETARVRHVFGLFNCHWLETLEHGLAQAQQAHEALLRSGELEFACYTFFTSQTALLDTAATLADLAVENRRALAFAEKTGNRHATESYTAFRGLLTALDEEAAFPTDEIPDANPMAACFHHTTRALIACLLGEDENHTRHAEAAARLAPYITGFYPTALINFLESLALLSRQRRGDLDPALPGRVAANQDWLAARAADAPANFSHLHDLVEAERLAVAGHGNTALAVYERAIRRAKAHHRPWHAALATEKAARAYLALDLEEAGHRLLEQARARYAAWGATRKCAALAAEFPFLHTAPTGWRDAQPLLAAMQQLAALRSVPQLAEATAEILHRLSGATDVQVLAPDENDEWMLKAGYHDKDSLPRKTLAEAEKNAVVASSVVRLGLRSLQPVITDDAVADTRFATDPRYRDRERCAVLGIPVLSRNRAVAFVVLENHRLRGAFTAGIADTVGTLCGQLGVSLENARLYRSLETKVEERTKELRAAEQSLARTAFELTANIPVGTYVLEFDTEGNPHFTFVSERWLKMLDLRREDVLADHSLAVSAVHPDERRNFNRLNTEAFAEQKRFFWEGRLVVRGETRWVTIESIPRARPGGGTIWEGAMIDITDRKRAEQQLQRVLDNLPIAVAATTLDSPAAMTFINEQFTRTFGYTLEDVPTVAAWAEKAYPDPDYRREVFRDWDEAVFRAIKTRGSVESMEFEVACKDGTKRAIIFRAVVLDDRLLTSMTDVTDQKKAERALRALREKVERTAYELTENIPVGTYTMVQPPGGGMAYFSFMSTRFLELTGLDREAARDNPMNAFACVHPDDQEEWVRKNAYVFEHKLPFNEECRIFVKGKTRWITAESKPRDLPDGSVVWEGVLTDITDRKLAEQKLAESEARLRKILDNIPVPLAINTPDRNGRITFLNKAFVETFGYNLDDIPTVDHWALLAYPDAGYRKNTFEFWGAAVEKAARTRGTIEPMEFRVCCKKGESRDVLINAVAMQDMLLVGFVDITARKRAEAHARELEAGHRRDLETKLRTSLEAAAVAHEINQPLSVILFQSKLALENEEDAREAVARIADEAQRVVATIDKMKTLLRNVQTDHRRVDLASVVRSALLYNKGMLARHAIDVHTSGLRETCTIMGDDAQLQLALTNILRNSAEAIDESDAEKREISISLARRDGQAELCIGDSGPGWSGAEKEDTPLTTTKSGGTGIGLYVVRTAVQNHGGSIAFGRSSLGGAEVRLKFPCA